MIIYIVKKWDRYKWEKINIVEKIGHDFLKNKNKMLKNKKLKRGRRESDIQIDVAKFKCGLMYISAF